MIDKNVFAKLSIMILVIVLGLSLSSCNYISGEKDSTESSQQSGEKIDQEKDIILSENAKYYKKQLLEFFKNSDDFESPKREYGVEEFLDIYSENFLAHVIYPQGNLRELDKVCDEWANSTLKTYQDKEKIDRGELVLSYNSYNVDNQYVVVEFSGEYYNQNYAHPISINSSFNADIVTGKVLSIDDVLKTRELSRLREYVIKKENLKKDAVDEELLDNWKLLENGVEIVLEKGKYLPESEGNVKIFASYDMLHSESEFDISEDVQEDVEGDLDEKTLTEKEKENFDKLESKQVEMEKIEVSEDDKLIALTFDDGPGAHTERLLDILKKYNVRATFFVLGSQIDTNPDLLPRMVADGHEIGGHSWTHRSFNNLSDEELTKEIMQTRAKIASLTGIDPLSVRPPYGAFNDRVKAIGKDLGVHFVNWNIDTVDWKTRNAQSTYNEIINTAANGNIVLCHDIHSSSVDSMESVIPKLLEEGYTFVTVSDLLLVGQGEIKAGEVYFSMYN